MKGARTFKTLAIVLAALATAVAGARSGPALAAVRPAIVSTTTSPSAHDHAHDHDPDHEAAPHTHGGVAAATQAAAAPGGPCGDLEPMVAPDGTFLGCTHGDDADHVGFQQMLASVPTIDAQLSPAPSTVPCPPGDDGVSGARVQALYVRESTAPSTYAASMGTFRKIFNDAEDLLQRSAAKTGGSRHFRWVHDGACHVSVTEVVVPTGSLATFSATITAVRNLGYTSTQRKYLLITDSTVYCGIGNLYLDDAPTTGLHTNYSDGVFAEFARIDNRSGCWTGFVALHELFHNLGAVQASSAHSTTAGHCADEWDVLCYSDGGLRVGQTLTYTCPVELLDCGDDDYFHLSPPVGSYLSTHWDTASSRFLTATAVPAIPQAAADAFDVPFGIAASIPAPGLFANDSFDAGHVRGALITRQPYSGAVVTVNADGSVAIAAGAPNYLSDTFTYRPVLDDAMWGPAVTVTLYKAPGQPTGVTGTLSASGVPQVSWTLSPSGLYANEHLDIERSTDGGATWVPVASQTSCCSLTDYNATTGTPNRYRVRNVGPRVASSWAASAAVDVPARIGTPTVAASGPKTRVTAPTGIVVAPTTRRSAPAAG